MHNGQCTVVEPEPRQEHCLLAVALSMAQRRWMVELSLKGWLQAWPRLIVTNWEDEGAPADMMRWGTGLTFRGLAPLLCLGDALCGRFEWVVFMLYIDDDTIIDP